MPQPHRWLCLLWNTASLMMFENIHSTYALKFKHVLYKDAIFEIEFWSRFHLLLSRTHDEVETLLYGKSKQGNIASIRERKELCR